MSSLPLAGVRVLEVSLCTVSERQPPRARHAELGPLSRSWLDSLLDPMLAVGYLHYVAPPSAQADWNIRAVVLADFGADVVRVDRLGTSFNPDALSRSVSSMQDQRSRADSSAHSGKRSVSISVKSASGIALLKTLLSAPAGGCSNPKCKCAQSAHPTCSSNRGPWRADVLIDPFRPGVLERLGLGPDVLLKANPGLIIARLTGFRREGPYSKMAGHDLNYIALSGVLSESDVVSSLSSG